MIIPEHEASVAKRVSSRVREKVQRIGAVVNMDGIDRSVLYSAVSRNEWRVEAIELEKRVRDLEAAAKLVIENDGQIGLHALGQAVSR